MSNRAARRQAAKAIRSHVRRIRKANAVRTVEISCSRWRIAKGALLAALLDLRPGWLGLFVRGMLRPRDTVVRSLALIEQSRGTRGSRAYYSALMLHTSA